MEITRSSILREVLAEKEEQMYKYSKFRAGLTPLPGYEQVFEDRRKECDLLRGMIRAAMDREHEDGLMDAQRGTQGMLQNPEVQKQLADWQKDLMDGKQPDMSWADKQPMTPDEAVLRRRYRKAEGFKPEPVTYPGGE